MHVGPAVALVYETEQPLREGARSMNVPQQTIDWLSEPENPAVAVLTRKHLLEKPMTAASEALWKRRNDYPLVAAILDAERDDGSWDVPSRDYQKYRGSLWQIHLLGEVYADPADERVSRGAAYAFARQVDDGSWSASNGRRGGSIPCLTANVGRALGRLGYERDERVLAALRFCSDLRRELGCIDCRQMAEFHLNHYCHMLTPKLLLFLAEVPQELWPDGAEELRDECIEKLRDKQVFRSLPEESAAFEEAFWSLPASGREGVRERFMAAHPELHYKQKAGWLRFGYPLSYNSDTLEALWALALHGEPARPEYADALRVVREAADTQMRWKLRNSLNSKMYADVEKKGQPSKWLTLRALLVLKHFSEDSIEGDAGGA